MSKLDEGQAFVNGKLLEIADQIDWKEFNEEMDKNMFEAALGVRKKDDKKLKYPGLLHISRHLLFQD